MLRPCISVIPLLLVATVGLRQADCWTAATSIFASTVPQQATLKPRDGVPSDDQEATVADGDIPKTLSGRVTYTGPSIALRQIQIIKDEEVCGQGPKQIAEVEVSDDGGLANVVVELQGAKPPETGWLWVAPADGYAIRQKNCGFEPRLLVMPNGSELVVYNDDPVAHNVNTGQFNQMQPGGAAPIKKQIRSRRPIRVTCNIHNWMEGWIYTAQSPYYAVSQPDGSFSISTSDVPPGTYRVTAWHPFLRKKKLNVTLGDGDNRLDIQFDK